MIIKNLSSKVAGQRTGSGGRCREGLWTI